MKEQLKQFLKHYEQEVMTAADAMRREEIPPITEELFSLFEKTGNRITYENVYFRRRKFLAVYGMAALLHRRKEDLCMLEKIIREICREICWALPAHVNRVQQPDTWMITVDLFASETAFALTEIGSLLKEELPGEILAEIREKAMSRVLLPFEQSPIPYGIWENCDHNWNAVCAGSIGCAAIELLKEEPKRLEKLLSRIQNSLTHYVDGFSDDGACMEGLSYFTYGMSFFAAFAQKLEAYTHGACDLLAGEKLKKMMEFQQKCYFPGGLSICFSDGSSQEKFRVGLTCYLSMKDEKVQFPAMELAAGLDSDNCYRWAILYRDYRFTLDCLQSLEDKAAPGFSQAASSVSDAHSGHTARTSVLGTNVSSCQETLPQAQWTICRGLHAAAGAAIKGGHNGEPHNHNDVGSFHYAIGKELFFSDLGAGEYTREYFQPETRYTIFVNQSQSHNVPIIGGHGQKPGKEYGCSLFETDGKGHTKLALEGAYGEPGLASFLRCLDFVENEGSLTVTDSFEGDPKLEILENLVTPWLPRISGNQVILQGKSHRCILTVQGSEEISVSEQTYSDHKGILQKVYLLRWNVSMADGKGTARYRIAVFS
ncbi:MAG: heparinase II/III family protein [Candidatus Limivivens sp.]|nr:heparinase II/III family protein [Candidatus Limivivens sp.]